MINGSDILLYVDDGSGPTLVGSQRDVTFDESNESVDFSSKDSRAKRVRPGRYASTISLDSLYVPTDAGYLALQSSLRNGTSIIVVNEEDGVYIESATGYVMALSRTGPDQGESTVSATIEIDGEWSAGT
jgi:TP901-1 family phage major tail protein